MPKQKYNFYQIIFQAILLTTITVMILKTFTVRGGNFAAAKKGFFNPFRSELSLPRKSGQMPNELMNAQEIQDASLATGEAIDKTGGEDRFGEVGILLRVFASLAPDDGIFVMRFSNGKVLLATADAETCSQIIRIKPGHPSDVARKIGSLEPVVR